MEALAWYTGRKYDDMMRDVLSVAGLLVPDRSSWSLLIPVLPLLRRLAQVKL